MTDPAAHLADLIERIARLSEAEAWAGGLNPTQRAALGYLAAANRFSRAPKHVTAYLGATKGSVSQTLKALARKGLVEERPNPDDRRSVTYRPTAAGLRAVAGDRGLAAAIAGLPGAERAALDHVLTGLLRAHLAAAGGTLFGLCHGCRHHKRAEGGGRACALLGVALAEAEADQLCHEFAPAA